MSPRTRKRTTFSERFREDENGNIDDIKSGERDVEIFYESNYPGSNECYHSQYGTFYGEWQNTSGFKTWIYSNYAVRFPHELVFSEIDTSFNSMNWNKLPTSTKAGIIQILAELDDTLAIFTRKFWKSFSYGAFTWGVIPFVSDVKAVYDTVRNLSVDLAKFDYEDEQVIPIDILDTSSSHIHQISGLAKIRQTGFGSLDSGLYAELDRFGFHPDLATAWDLIPLSFVVDYLLPIGDYLSSFRQGGWVRSIAFEGWTTVHFKGDHTYGRNAIGSSWPLVWLSTSSVEYFQRWHGSKVLSSTHDFDFALEMPSIKELFNMLYIFVLSKRR